MKSTQAIRGGIALMVVAGSLTVLTSCGGQADDSVDTKTSAVVAGTYVQCTFSAPAPAGYPQKKCLFSQINSSICFCYPPDSNTVDEMDYQLITVLHTPPGNMSSISYANGSTADRSNRSRTRCRWVWTSI